MEFISNYKKYREIFDEYVSHYDNSNSMISKKISHSYRVAIHAANIAKSLDLDERQIEISYICGLFHDIGRFEQATQSHSFDDKYFQDHGDYGAKILEDGIAKKITEDKEIQNIIIVATKYHNKYAIGKVTPKEELYCKITRDADKIDIMENQMNKVEGTYKMDPKMLEQVYSKTLCKNGEVKNPIDHILRMLCFIYDMHFKYSFDYLKEKNIIEKKLELIKKHSAEDTSELIEFVNNYIKER